MCKVFWQNATVNPLLVCFVFVLYKESNGPTDNYAAIAQVDIQRQEPESLRKWREEQKARLEALGESQKGS